MKDKIIEPADVFVAGLSFNFWWSIYGFETSYWEDMIIHYKKRAGNTVSQATQVDTKGYIRQLIKEGDEKGLNEECEWFGKTPDELLGAGRILYAYSYGDPDYADFSEVPLEAPRNKQGLKPCYIAMFHPAEEITKDVVSEAARQYCRDFFRIPFSRVHVLGKPRKGYARKEFEEEQRLREEHREFIRMGGKFKIQMTPELIEQLFGEEISGLGLSGKIAYGFYRDGNYYAVLRDGSEVHIRTNLRLID